MQKEYKIVLSDENISSELGERSKFGGNPNWIQNDETPKCPHCKKQMEFIAQIDSMGYTGFVATTREPMFGDVGMIYVFFCHKCGISQSIFQE
ncbi:MAG: hypothetical protein MJ211_04925 [Bacteroidales bacterium]|nr:hypothetical protein [Bacteroidales bacterium]